MENDKEKIEDLNNNKLNEMVDIGVWTRKKTKNDNKETKENYNEEKEKL